MRFGWALSCVLVFTSCGSSARQPTELPPATGSSPSSAGTSGAGGETPSSGGSDGGSENQPATTCDPESTPLDFGCASDAAAVFVWDSAKSILESPKGDDFNPGTGRKPVASLNRAVAIANSTGRSLILVCGSAIAGGLHQTGLATKLRIIGGYSCPDQILPWVGGGSPTKLYGDSRHPVIEVRDSPGQLTIENISIDESANSDPGAQRIGIILENAKVTLRKVTIVTGNGNSGSDGKVGKSTFASATELWSASRRGGPPCRLTCRDGSTSEGGQGEVVRPHAAATAGLPALGGGAPGVATFVGGYGMQCAKGKTTGGDGANGKSGANGAGAAIYGRIAGGTFVGQAGQAGIRGEVGQGGGGSGAALDLNGYSGACGGCGGLAGTAGLAGGSSIGILSIRSAIRIESSVIIIGNGGPGGVGAAGEKGQPGGLVAYTVSQLEPDCSPGKGGDGGNGGSGGGGAGGLSVGILFVGGAPELVTTTITQGQPGKGGLGGSPGVNPGMDGLAAETLELKTPSEPACSGSPHPCAEASGLMACADTMTCEPVLQCLSVCQQALDEKGCSPTNGCAWDGTSCKTSSNQCNGLRESSCKTNSYCQWGSGCTGTPIVCEVLQPAQCTKIRGCVTGI